MGEFVVLHEHRKPPRDAAPVSGFIRIPGIKSIRCSLVSVSRDGACVRAAHALPDYFVLRSAAARCERMCQVVWCKDDVVGVRFVSAKTMGRSPSRRKSAG